MIISDNVWDSGMAGADALIDAIIDSFASKGRLLFLGAYCFQDLPCAAKECSSEWPLKPFR